MRVGVVGSRDSRKSSLVHRYLTGRCCDDDDDDEREGRDDGEDGASARQESSGGGGGGGRFKKEVSVDGSSYLLLVRDEAPAEEARHVAAWADALLLVFACDSESSFARIPALFSVVARTRGRELPPVLLIGTQDGIRASRPRAVDSERAERLAQQLHPGCSYFETCAAYGFNVDSVFGQCFLASCR